MQIQFPSTFDGPKYWSNFSYFLYKFTKNNEFENKEQILSNVS